MSEMNRQQLCAALSISESTVRRLEQLGLPYTPVGKRSHRYDLDECKTWLKANPPNTEARIAGATSKSLADAADAFTESCRHVKLRVMPSEK